MSHTCLASSTIYSSDPIKETLSVHHSDQCKCIIGACCLHGIVVHIAPTRTMRGILSIPSSHHLPFPYGDLRCCYSQRKHLRWHFDFCGTTGVSPVDVIYSPWEEERRGSTALASFPMEHEIMLMHGHLYFSLPLKSLSPAAAAAAVHFSEVGALQTLRSC